jgi:hypothetical protein
VLATGALAVPAVALAAGGDDPASQTTPTQQQEQPQPDQQRPDRGDCPEHDGQQGGGSGDSSQTQL